MVSWGTKMKSGGEYNNPGILSREYCEEGFPQGEAGVQLPEKGDGVLDRQKQQTLTTQRLVALFWEWCGVCVHDVYRAPSYSARHLEDPPRWLVVAVLIIILFIFVAGWSACEVRHATLSPCAYVGKFTSSKGGKSASRIWSFFKRIPVYIVAVGSLMLLTD